MRERDIKQGKKTHVKCWERERERANKFNTDVNTDFSMIMFLSASVSSQKVMSQATTQLSLKIAIFQWEHAEPR